MAKAAKNFKKLIISKLNVALAEFQQDLGEKKFNRVIKKTAKLVSRDIKRKAIKKFDDDQKEVTPIHAEEA